MLQCSINFIMNTKKNPEITKERLVIETLEQVLPGAEIYIMNDDGNTMKYLPIRPLEKETPITEKKEEGGDQNNEG